MDWKLFFLLFSVVLINFILSATNGVVEAAPKSGHGHGHGDGLEDIVATALSTQLKEKQHMLPVSETHYNLSVAWRGLKRFVTKKVVGMVSPSLLKEAEVGHTLNDLVHKNSHNGKLKSLTVPHPHLTPKKRYDGESSEPNSGDEADDEDDEEEKPKEKSKKKKK